MIPKSTVNPTSGLPPDAPNVTEIPVIPDNRCYDLAGIKKPNVVLTVFAGIVYSYVRISGILSLFITRTCVALT